SSLTLNPGQQGTVNAQLQGNLPAPGSYEGFIIIDNNNNTRVQVPYLYLVSDGVPYNIFPLINANFVGLVNDPDPFLVGFKLIDRYGVPLANVPVQFQVVSGGGSIGSSDAQTDRLGIAAALVSLGPQEGDQVFTAQAGGL